MQIGPAGADRECAPVHPPMPCRHCPVGPSQNKTLPESRIACPPSPCLGTTELLGPSPIWQRQRPLGGGRDLPPPPARELLVHFFQRLTRLCATRFDQARVTVPV